MIRSLVRAALVVALVLPLVGCETKKLSIAVQAFGDGNVDGIWLWRLDETSGEYLRVCDLRFTDSYVGEDGREYLGYRQHCPGGSPGVDLRASFVRDDQSPDTIGIEIYYMRWEETGTYRATAYNAGGESVLSPSSVQI
ncbi:MAG: hypothetical protein QNK03_26470 [Myxococcota bacterium]|nr:hypothetical protein [Myxococcota bacterium]